MDTTPDPPAPDRTDDTVLLSELAQELGVTVAAVTNWRARFVDFPPPVDPAEPQLRYPREALLEWAMAHGRISPGRLVAPKLRHRYSPVEQLARHAHALVKAEQAASEDPVTRAIPNDMRTHRLRLALAADRALAVAALALWRARHPGPDDIERLGPLVDVTAQLRDTVGDGPVDEALAALGEQIAALPPDDPAAWSHLVDALRGDHMFLVGRPAISTRRLWQIVGPLHDEVDTVVDPVCGDGGLLAEAARTRGRSVRLVGQELDPLRAATARSLLDVEGFPHEILVGDSSDADQVRARLPHGRRTLMVADLPLRSLDPARTALPADHWIEVARTWLDDDEQARAALVVRTPWLSRANRRRTKRTAGLTADGALRAVAVGPATGPRGVSSESVVVLGPPAEPRPNVLMVNLAAAAERPDDEVAGEVRDAVDRWRAGATGGNGPVAVVVAAGDVAAARSIAPPSYTEVSATELEQLHRRAAKPTPDRGFGVPAPLTGAAPEAPVLPALHMPVAAVRELQEALRQAAADPQPVAAGSLDLGWLVRPHDDTPRLHILGANQLVGGSGDRTRSGRRRIPIVTLVTSSAEFGSVELHRDDHVGDTALRRGLVGFEITEAGRDVGLTPEFLAGWLSSVVAQQHLRRIVREGRTRHTTSLDDLRSLPLPEGFPNRALLERIADRWTAFEAVRSFAAELPEALAYWQLHLADEPPTAD